LLPQSEHLEVACSIPQAVYAVKRRITAVEAAIMVSFKCGLFRSRIAVTLNPILYPGEPEFPARARIVRALAEDTTEVKHGSVIFVVEPV
jgi:hypothetical protein